MLRVIFFCASATAKARRLVRGGAVLAVLACVSCASPGPSGSPTAPTQAESAASGIISAAPQVSDRPVEAPPANSQLGQASRLAVSGQAWTSVFDEQFDGDSLDTDVWNYRQEGVYGATSNRSRAASSAEAVEVDDGALGLSVLVNPDREDHYLNGHVSTEDTFSFRHGLVAARVKFQRQRGQHGAFWIQTPQAPQIGAGPDANGAEIDVAEYFGESYPDGGLSQFVHFLAEDGAWTKLGGLLPSVTSKLPADATWWNRFHVFSVEWTEEEYIFRIDGRETWRTQSGVSEVEQFLVLSLLNSDWELPQLDESRLPASMYVDWVRVWQRPE